MQDTLDLLVKIRYGDLLDVNKFYAININENYISLQANKPKTLEAERELLGSFEFVKKHTAVADVLTLFETYEKYYTIKDIKYLVRITLTSNA